MELYSNQEEKKWYGTFKKNILALNEYFKTWLRDEKTKMAVYKIWEWRNRH